MGDQMELDEGGDWACSGESIRRLYETGPDYDGDEEPTQTDIDKPDPDRGCDEDYPHAFYYYASKKCCEHEPEDHHYYGDYYHQICRSRGPFKPDEGCNEDYPFAFVSWGTKTCCEHEPEDDSYYNADYHQRCRSSGPFRVKPDPVEGCDEDYPYGFVDFQAKKCCEGEPIDHEWYSADYHQVCNHGNKFADLTCPESHKFASPPELIVRNYPHVSGRMCCFSETQCEGSMGIGCPGNYMDYDTYTDHNTCKDHPSVRTPASKCPACWKENDDNECEFDTSATECFTQTCNNGAMQLSINFENLFNSKASDIGDYNAQIGVDAENWPSQSIEFTEDAILMKLKVTT